MNDFDLGVWCDDCGHRHQAREHAVPCIVHPKMMTTDVHRRCSMCRHPSANAVGVLRELGLVTR